MSIIFQTDERKILMFLDYVLKVKFNRMMGIYIHDGGNVEETRQRRDRIPEKYFRLLFNRDYCQIHKKQSNIHGHPSIQS